LDDRLAIAREIPRLRRFARALTRDAGTADDLVQDCLVRGLSRRDQVSEPAKLRSWLFAILHNLFRDRQRQKAREPQTASIHLISDRQFVVPPNQHEALAVTSAIEALSLLPDDQREALALVAIEGCSYREAAEILEIPTGTLMSRLSRARERMRELLEAPAPRGGHLRSVKP
jgi:RNA polymerase sigma-70 factor (ECF subfamily)